MMMDLVSGVGVDGDVILFSTHSDAVGGGWPYGVNFDIPNFGSMDCIVCGD
jgi:hypothetical protein